MDACFQVSVYAVPDKKDQVKYALDSAAKLLEFYNEFFGIHYPLNKLGGCICTQLLWRARFSGRDHYNAHYLHASVLFVIM